MDHVEGPSHILLVGKEGQHCLTSYISSFFHFIFEFYIGEEENESMMDHLERKEKILNVLDLLMFAHGCATCT